MIIRELWIQLVESLLVVVVYLVESMLVVVSVEVFLPSSSMEVAALGFWENQVKKYLPTLC